MARARSCCVAIRSRNAEDTLEGTVRSVVRAIESCDDHAVATGNAHHNGSTSVVADRIAAGIGRVRVVHHHPDQDAAQVYRARLRATMVNQRP